MPADASPSAGRARWSRRRRVLVGLAVTLVVLLLAGVVYQRVGTARDRDRWQPDELAEGGLHLRCDGPQDQPLTVVLEAASGGSALDWALVQGELAGTLRVCSYDRAGRGWSEGRTADATLASTADDLHRALVATGETGPYVLVGHSFGGVYAREFQRGFADEVAGLMLVDSAHPGEEALLGKLHVSDGGLRWARMVAPVGLMRLYLATGGSLGYDALPDDARSELNALWSSSRHLRSIADEVAAAPALRAEAAALGSVGDLPTVVVSADEELFDGWATLQADLARIGESVTTLTVPGSTHQSLLYEPAHAAVVAEQVRTLAAEVTPTAP
ncbi:MAG TPA: alpha/beta hydrolase [Ilumatobacter sp.]|nr:alpha/beta hydrolase [Ilumatobacter sp.]